MAIDLGRWLRDRKRQAVDLFDANTQADQQKRLAAGQPRFYQQQQQAQRQAPQQTAPQQSAPRQVKLDQSIYKQPSVQDLVNKSYGTGVSSFVNRVKDVVDPNTQADQIKRFAKTGIKENYNQEQQRLTKEASARPTNRSLPNQFAASGLREVTNFFGKTPGSVSNLYGATLKSENPVVKTLRGAIPGMNAAANADKQVGGVVSSQFQSRGNQLNKAIDDKVSQSRIGQRQGENKWAVGAGSVAAQLPLQIATGGAGIAGQSTQLASNEYNNARNSGKSNDSALLTGALQGGASYVSEKVGLDKLLPGSGSSNFLINTLKRIATEGTQEGQQQFTQNLITNKLYNSNQGLSDGVKESAILGGLSGGVASPAIDLATNTNTAVDQPSFTPQDIEVMKDISNVQMNPQAYTPREQAILQSSAIDLLNRTGVDLISGSRADINERAGQAIESFQNNQIPIEKIQTAPVYELPNASSMVQRIRAAKERVIQPLNEVGAIGNDVRPDATDNVPDQSPLDTNQNQQTQSPQLSPEQNVPLTPQIQELPLQQEQMQSTQPQSYQEDASLVNPGVDMTSLNRRQQSPDQQQYLEYNQEPKTEVSQSFANRVAQSRLATRASTSEQLTPDLRQEIVAPDYTKQNNNEQQLKSAAFLDQNSLQAVSDVNARLDSKKSGTDAQTVSDAISTIKMLDELGGDTNLQQASDLVDKLSLRLTEAGQTVQAASLLYNRTPQGLYYGALKTLKKAGVEITPKIEQQLQEKLTIVKETEPNTDSGDLARHDFIEQVNKLIPSKASSKLVNIWKAGLLTSPTTTVGNLTANTLEQGLKRTYEDPIATGVDAIMSVFTGKRSKSLTGKGVLSGVKEGALKGVKYFKTGYDPRNPNQKFDIQEIHYSDTPAGKAAETYTQAVFRTMGAQDQPFYYASLRNSLYDQAITEAKNSGFKGSQRDTFIKKFVTEPSKKAMQLADTEAKYDVFQNKTMLGEAASGFKGKLGAVGDFIVPFSGVPSSIATRIIERTPIGIATEVISQRRAKNFDQRKMAQALARGTTGVVMAGIGKALADSDLLTLAFPKDEKERKLWELEGKQPYSIKVGGKWRSLNYFQPAGTLIAAGGEYSKAKKEGASEQEAWTRTVASAGKALSEQSFLKGVSGAINVINDPTRFASRFLEQTAGSVVPNVIRATTRAGDTEQRQINSPLDAVKSGIPGLNTSLATKVNAFGEDVKRKTSRLGSLFDPTRPSDALPTDDTANELRRLFDAGQGVMTPEFAKNTLGGDSKLNEKQITELQKKIYPEIKKEWDSIIKDQRYSELDDEGKMKALRDAAENISTARKAEYAANNSLGKFAPGYTGKEQKLSYDQKNVLKGNKVDFLTKDTKEEDFNKSPDAEYKFKLADYEEKKSKGEYNDVENIKKQKELRKLKVGSTYDKKVRDLYSLSKGDIYDYVSTNEQEGKKLAEQLIAYDKSLKDAGITSSLKFKNGIAPSKKGGGKGKGKGKGGRKKSVAYDLSSVYSANTNTYKKLQSLLSKTNVAPKTNAPKPKKVALKKVAAK